MHLDKRIECVGPWSMEYSKAELLQLKPHPFICMKNFIDKKVGNRRN